MLNQVPAIISSVSFELVSKPPGQRDSTGNSDAVLVANRVLKCPLGSDVAARATLRQATPTL